MKCCNVVVHPANKRIIKLKVVLKRKVYEQRVSTGPKSTHCCPRGMKKLIVKMTALLLFPATLSSCFCYVYSCKENWLQGLSFCDCLSQRASNKPSVRCVDEITAPKCAKEACAEAVKKLLRPGEWDNSLNQSLFQKSEGVALIKMERVLCLLVKEEMMIVSFIGDLFLFAERSTFIRVLKRKPTKKFQ